MSDHPGEVATEPKAADFYRDHLPTHTVEKGPGRVVLEFEFTQAHLNAAGMVHGGVISALLDVAAAGAAAMTAEDAVRAYGITISLTVNFIAGAQAGRARISGETIGGGRRTKFVDCRLNDSTGTLCATASATVKVVDLGAA